MCMFTESGREGESGGERKREKRGLECAHESERRRDQVCKKVDGCINY